MVFGMPVGNLPRARGSRLGRIHSLWFTLCPHAACPPVSPAVKLSQEMADFVGKAEIGRPELTSFFWKYVKDKGLQVMSVGGEKLNGAAAKLLCGCP